jgi:hypothetical protein
MAEIVPFPLVRRRRLIGRLRRSRPGEFQHYIRQQVRMLRRAGIPEEEIDRQLRAVWCAVQLGGGNVPFGGVA